MRAKHQRLLEFQTKVNGFLKDHGRPLYLAPDMLGIACAEKIGICMDVDLMWYGVKENVAVLMEWKIRVI